MSVLEPFADLLCVPDELKDSRLRSQRDDFISPNMQFPSTRLSVLLQHHVHQLKHLFHDSILPQVIVSLAFELIVITSV
jgi:hypothetical protein